MTANSIANASEPISHTVSGAGAQRVVPEFLSVHHQSRGEFNDSVIPRFWPVTYRRITFLKATELAMIVSRPAELTTALENVVFLFAAAENEIPINSGKKYLG